MADDELRVEPISEKDFAEQKAEVEKYAQSVITEEVDKALKARIPEQRLPIAEDTKKTDEGNFSSFAQYLKSY